MNARYEKTKKHLIKMTNDESRATKLIEENYKYFEYLEQPKRIAEAIIIF